jgi:hypothetical protein
MPRRCKKADEGSSLLEVLVAIFVIAIAGMALYLGSARGLIAFSLAGRNARTAQQALMVDDTIRAEATRVRIPYWDTNWSSRSESGSASFPYYEGLADSSLSISEKNDCLIIESPNRRIVFSGVKLSKLGILDVGGATAGVDMAYSINGRLFRTISRFGANHASLHEEP